MIIFIANAQNIFDIQTSENRPQIHYQPKHIFRIIEPYVSDFDKFKQRLFMLQQHHKLEIKQINEHKQEVKKQIQNNKLKRIQFFKKLKQQILNELYNQHKLEHELKHKLKHNIQQIQKNELKSFKQIFLDKLQELKQRIKQIQRQQEQQAQLRKKYLKKLYEQWVELDDLIH